MGCAHNHPRAPSNVVRSSHADAVHFELTSSSPLWLFYLEVVCANSARTRKRLSNHARAERLHIESEARVSTLGDFGVVLANPREAGFQGATNIFMQLSVVFLHGLVDFVKL